MNVYAAETIIQKYDGTVMTELLFIRFAEEKIIFFSDDYFIYFYFIIVLYGFVTA